MGLRERIGRRGRAAVLLAAGLAGGGTAVAVASVAGSDGVIHACYAIVTDGNGNTVPAPGSNLRVIDPGAGQACTGTTVGARATELPLDWNVTGPQGPPGTPGAPGAPGGTVTVGSGHTFTLAGGQVVTVGSQPGLTLAPLPLRTAGAPLARTTLGSGGQALRFEILAVAFAASGGGGGAGKIHELTITKNYDKSSPKLMLACASGKHFPGAIIVVRKKGGQFLEYQLKDVVISAVQQSNGGGGKLPVESLTLNFTKIEIKYHA